MLSIIMAHEACLQADQDVNRYYGRMGQDSQRYYGAYERDTPAVPTTCRCKNADEESWEDFPQNNVIVKSDTDKKQKRRKTRRQSKFNSSTK